MIVDGRAIAEDVYAELQKRGERPGRPPRLGILVVGHHPVIESFVRIKARAAERLGVDLLRQDLPEHATTEDVVAALHELAESSDGVIVQLPLPDRIDTEAVLSAIPREKDVDGINPTIAANKKVVASPVALAIVEILERSGVAIAGAHAVVVGQGRLVGAPIAALLQELGASVSLVSRTRGSLAELKDADIAILGAGDSGLVKPEMIKEGVALVDAGTSESAGKIQGDADPACAEKCSVFTPVPGGVGPVAVAMIFRNLFDLIENKT